MRTPIVFYVTGTPKGQPRARARFGLRGVYDPGTADEWKKLVRGELMNAWDRVVFTGPVSLSLFFFFPRPKSHFAKKDGLAFCIRDSAPNWNPSRPDADNASKAVMDAMSARRMNPSDKGARKIKAALFALGVWKDDSQVCRLLVEKRYAGFGMSPGVMIEIKELE